SILCLYRGANPKLFRGLMRQVVRSAQEPNAEVASFRSVSMTSSGGRPLGFEYVRLYRGKQTSRSRIVSVSSEILSWERQWTSADGITTTFLDEHDAVVEEHRVLEVGKATQLDMSLQRIGPSSYRAHGLVLGRTKRETFESSMPLTTALSRAPRLAAFMRGELAELSAMTFDALRPSGPIAIHFERDAGQRVRQVDRGKTMFCDVDDRGLCAKLWNDADGWSSLLLEASGKLE
ncbi:MAG: hypothetical protein K0S65_5908, partial [Labilithrix sp.]|nr:hypothetical protein [Labilithrix sp.]